MKNILLKMLTAGVVMTPTAGIASSPFLNNSEDAKSVLKQNSPVAINAAPDFLIFGKEDKFYFGVGGSVIVTANFDMGHPIDNPNEFITADIPMGKMNGNGGSFGFSAQQSQLYINMVALPESPDRVGGFVGINFLGNNYLPILEYAYIRWRGLQAGYDYNLFSDSEAIPPSVDYEGANAITAQGTAGVRYSFGFGKNKDWELQAGAELPVVSATEAMLKGIDITESVTQRVPDIPVALKYSWGDGGHVRLSGVLRNLYSRNLLLHKNIDRLGWGVQLSASAEILPGLTGYTQLVYGKGIASYIQDLSGLGLDMVPTVEGRSLTTVKCWGAYGALQYAFNDKFSVVGTYSQVRGYPGSYSGGSEVYDIQYRYAQYAAGSLFYNITSNLTGGLEYIWGRRVDCNGEKGASTRLQASLNFSF